MTDRIQQDIINKRDMNLDFIKLLACIAVIGLHTLQKDLSLLNSTLYYLCGFAVPAFFMASGYVLLNREVATFQYVIRKVLALIRVVILWNVVILIGKLLVSAIFNIQSDLTIIDLIKETIKSLLQKGTLWQLWYLGALMIIYCLLPILQRINQGDNKKLRGTGLSYNLICLWIFTILISVILQGSSMILGTPVQKRVIQTFRLWTWLQYFMLGGGDKGLYSIYYSEIFYKSAYNVYGAVDNLHFNISEFDWKICTS